LESSGAGGRHARDVICAPPEDPPLGAAETAIGELDPVSAAFGRHPPMSENKTAETIPAVFRPKMHPRARDIETRNPNTNPTKSRLD
jgi:hypothetical protein